MDSDLMMPSGMTATTTTTTPTTLLCWGCGEFGQHCQGHQNDVSFQESEVMHFGSATALGAVTHVSCGASHTVAVTESGEVYAWGNGNSGQLGNGDPQTRWSPALASVSPTVPGGGRIRTAACGSRHTLAVTDRGHVISFGNNFYAQLGYNFRDKNYKENQMRPHWLEFLQHRPVSQVACGDKHSLFLFQDGSVAAVGNNAHGQLGDGSREESTVPKGVDLEEKVTTVTCGNHHCLVITETGQVYAWGYGKACGKRRHDVTTPEVISFKGRQVVQVAGGSTHSLALTAGGTVYCWGFGMDGQLGLGSVVMATRPRRLRHSFLEEGASFVACGDAFSAVITASGRLYLWGRDSHSIEGGRGPLHKVTEPLCLNPHPSPPLRHLACGAWHVAALTGQPDFVPASEADSACSDDEETASSTHSVYSRLSSANSANSGGRRSPRTNGLGGGGGGRMEVSAPPHNTTTPTTTRGPSVVKPPPFLVARGKTKLTIGEFYATSSEASSSDRNSRRSSRPLHPSTNSPQPPSTQPPKPHPPTPTPSPTKTTPLVIEMPSMPVDPDSDLEEPLPVSTAEEMKMDEDQGVKSDHPKTGNALSPLFLPRESPSSAGSRKNEDEMRSLSRSSNTSRSGSGSEWPPARVREQLKDLEETATPGKGLSGAKTGADTGEDRARRGGGGERGGGAVTGGGEAIPSAEVVSWGAKSRATSITANHPTAPATRSPPTRPSPHREKSIVASKNVDLLDACALLTGPPSSPKKGPNTLYTPGRPQGVDRGAVGGLGYFQEIFGAFPSAFEADLGDFDFDYLEASPRTLPRDVALQPVPMVQLEGDFGEVPEEATLKARSEEKVSRSRSTLTSRDLDWIDQLLLQKAMSQAPRHVKRSATFFGALSGQVTRSPTKFFRKPATPSSSGHPLPRTTPSPATHSHPTPYTPLARSRTHMGGGGERGGGRRGGGGEGSTRPSTRGLGAVTGGKSVSGDRRSDTLKVPANAAFPPGRNPQDSKPASAKKPFFSSAASWRQRPPELPEHLFHEVQIQSAPTSSKLGGRKHVAFAEDAKPASGATSKVVLTKSSSTEAPQACARPFPAFGVSGSSSLASPRGGGGSSSEMVAENAGVPLLKEGANPSADRRSSGKTPSRAEDSSGKTTNEDSKLLNNARQAPTLTYRTSPKKEPDSGTQALQQLSPRSGGHKPLPGNSRSTLLTPASRLNRSRTKMILSGTGERNRKQFN